MNTQVITEVTQATLADAMTFPEVVTKLLATGVEYYHVDYITLRKTFYDVQGNTVTTPIPYEALPAVNPDFNLTELRAAIADSQLRGQTYRDFSIRAMQAGIQGYFAFLRGQRVIYLGRQGDNHTEWFPGAGPKQS